MVGNIDLKEEGFAVQQLSHKYKDCPRFSISNPGFDAIEAVLYPEETDCIFYLHDKNQQIHSAQTYVEHKEKMEKICLVNLIEVV